MNTDETRAGYAFMLIEHAEILGDERIQTSPVTQSMVKARVLSFAQHYAEASGLGVVTGANIDQVVVHAQEFLLANQSLADQWFVAHPQKGAKDD